MELTELTQSDIEQNERDWFYHDAHKSQCIDFLRLEVEHDRIDANMLMLAYLILKHGRVI